MGLFRASSINRDQEEKEGRYDEEVEEFKEALTGMNLDLMG